MRSNESIHLRPPDELVRGIDAYRRSQANPPSRPRAVEELVQAALAARVTAQIPASEIADLADVR
jgi:hypothetical protein